MFSYRHQLIALSLIRRSCHFTEAFENFVKVNFSCSIRNCSYSQNYTFVLRRRLPICCVSHVAYIFTRHNDYGSNRSGLQTLTQPHVIAMPIVASSIAALVSSQELPSEGIVGDPGIGDPTSLLITTKYSIEGANFPEWFDSFGYAVRFYST